MQEYGVSAVPITYVIDREGKVVEAWVGSQAGIPRATELLEKLGIE
jgi:peroxiredoxin